MKGFTRKRHAGEKNKCGKSGQDGRPRRRTEGLIRQGAAVLCAVAFCVGLLCGCADKQKEERPAEEETLPSGYTGMAGSSPQLDYQIEAMYPSVLTDQLGYAADSAKIVFFVGGEIGDGYDVVESETGKTVYSGKMAYAGRDEELQKTVCYGTFTEMVEEGIYYIRAASLGQSYPFVISSAMYADLFRELCLSFEEHWSGDGTYEAEALVQDAPAISNLLIAYEYYTGIFGDDIGCAYSGNTVPDLLDLVAVRVAQIRTLDPAKLSYGELAAYTGILAKFAQDYKAVDAAKAAECLAAAQEGYALLAQMQTPERYDGMRFYAAAELYRATGYSAYHTEIRNYLTLTGTEEGANASGGMELYGRIAYLSAKYRVDKGLCDEIITELMSEVEVIAAAYGEEVYLAAQDYNEAACEDMVKLAVVNYAITNHEYVTVQENQLHYLLGRNPQGVSYLFAGIRCAEEQCITDNEEQSSALILLMCEMVQEEIKEED